MIVTSPLIALEKRINTMAAPTTILLVEDHPGDVRLTEEAFAESDFDVDLHATTNGQAALEFINREDEYEDAPRPDIALLDLVMPEPDGEDLLHEIKHHPSLEDVPVIILTGMDDDYVRSQDLDLLKELEGLELSLTRVEN